MKKLILTLWFLAFPALAANYASPIFNNLTTQGTTTLAGATVFLGGNFSTSGAYPLTLTTTGSTNVTLPTSGTLLDASTAASTYAPQNNPTFTGTAHIPTLSVTGNGTVTGTLGVTGNLSAPVLPTGASTARTLSARFSDVLNAYDYGVKCDGATDNSAAYTAIENAEKPGAVVYFPPAPNSGSANKCLSSTNFVLNSGVDFYEVPGSVYLAPTASNVSSVLIFSAASNTYVYGLSVDGGGTTFTSSSNVILAYHASNVTFDHVQEQNTRGIGILINGSSYTTVENSTFTNVGGVYGTGNAQGIAFCCGTAANNVDNNVLNNTFYHTGLDAISVTNTSGTTIRGNRCYENLTTSEGACVYATGNVGLLTIENNVSMNSEGNGFDLGAADPTEDVLFVGNTSEYSGNNGVGDFGNATFTAIGNTVKDSGQATGQVGESGFAFSGSSASSVGTVLLAGNTVTDDQTTETQQYAIYSNSNTTFTGGVNIGQSNYLAGNLDGTFGGGGALTDYTYTQNPTNNAAALNASTTVTPTTGFTNTIPNGITTYILSPSGTLASGTITLPSSPVQNQYLVVLFDKAITSLTINPSSGQSLVGSQASAAANSSIVFTYSGTTWHLTSPASLVSAETTRAQGAEALLAPLASPTFTGTPTVPTAVAGTSTTQAASTAFALNTAGSMLITTSGTYTLPVGIHTLRYEIEGGAGGSGCGVVTSSGTAASGGGTGASSYPVIGWITAQQLSFSSQVTVTATVGAAGSPCVASGTTAGSTGSTPTAGGFSQLQVGSLGPFCSPGGGAGSNGQQGAGSAGGGLNGYGSACTNGNNASGATGGAASGNGGQSGGSAANGVTGPAGYSQGASGNGVAVGVAGSQPNTAYARAGIPGSGLASTPASISGAGNFTGLTSTFPTAGSSTCTGTSQNGANATLANEVDEFYGATGGAAASCTSSNGGNGGNAFGYGSSGGGGGDALVGYTAGSAGASDPGAILLTWN